MSGKITETMVAVGENPPPTGGPQSHNAKPTGLSQLVMRSTARNTSRMTRPHSTLTDAIEPVRKVAAMTTAHNGLASHGGTLIRRI